MVSKYQYCLAHTLFRAFSDTAEAASHQTEAGELSHNDWHDYSVQESNTESTEEQVLMAVFYLIVFEQCIQGSVQSADDQVIAIGEFNEYNCKWPKKLLPVFMLL